jgi:hypothetical protein
MGSLIVVCCVAWVIDFFGVQRDDRRIVVYCLSRKRDVLFSKE